MKFFSKTDLDYFQQVLYAKVTSRSPEWVQVRTTLTSVGVFSKTKYWAELFRQTPYSISYRNDCQFSGKIRRYTWAKIYLKGFEKSDIYFTVGVGRDSSESPFYLIYKLDCQRKQGLSSFQINSFDNYLNRHFPNKDFVKKISSKDLTEYNWDLLQQETDTFINNFKDIYKELIDIVWPNGINIESKVARICWNDLGWEKPCGSEGKSKNTEHTFESKGYGHEEWLFDLDRSIDGYHYGFVQAFHKGDHYGKTYDLHLYTLKHGREKAECYWVGRIKSAEVLTKDEQRKVFQIYQLNGWYTEMIQELNDVEVDGRDLEIVSEEELFNVKFKIDSTTVTRFDDLIHIYNPKEEIGPGYGRYGLKDLITTTYTVLNTSNVYKFKAGHNPTKTGTTKFDYTKKTINRTLKHKEIQKFMYSQLIVEYGEDHVGTEVPTGRGTSIDVVVVRPDKSQWFYEVKTYNQPLVCIREAFGQILEYAMFSRNNYADKLIVIGVNKPSDLEIEYLNHIRKIMGMKIYYQVFQLETQTLLNTFY